MSDFRVDRLSPILSPPIAEPAARQGNTVKNSEAFGSLLKSEILKQDGVRFSKHALSRLESRDIVLNPDDLEKLGSAVDRASEKGVRDSLVLMNNVAYIVSVPEKTVVTAMPAEETQDHVFTNIDGAVIV